MPRALEPKTPCPIVLECDKDKEPQPTFFAESKSYRDSDSMRQEMKATPTDQCGFEILKRNLVGWENMVGRDGSEIKFNPERLADVVTVSEVWELLGKIIANDHVTTEEKKS